MVLEGIQEDDQQQHFVFDEAQFDMDGKEYFTIEYFSGDIYKGELLGENRHGFGMFTYKKTQEKVLGMWQKNYCIKDGRKHPQLEITGELVPLAVTKYEGRRQKNSD